MDGESKKKNKTEENGGIELLDPKEGDIGHRRQVALGDDLKRSKGRK